MAAIALYDRLGFAEISRRLSVELDMLESRLAARPTGTSSVCTCTEPYDELCDRDPSMLRRLARELSDRMGAVVLGLGVEEGSVVRFVLLERGRVVDEYLSVPEFYGPLPPGDVVAMAANPTAVARLTGAEPGRVRALARTASSPADLAPAGELLGELADAFGLPGGDHGYAHARSLPGAVLIDRP